MRLDKILKSKYNSSSKLWTIQSFADEKFTKFSFSLQENAVIGCNLLLFPFQVVIFMVDELL